MPVTDSTIQAPIIRGKPTKLGPRTFRKQILPVGRVAHPDHALEFTRPMLERFVSNFTAGAYDQVPFVLVDDANRHNDDPERFRGEVKGLEAQDDGLYAILELTEKGAELVRDNPKLGVSPRLVSAPSPGASTPRKYPAIEHVAGTFKPRADGMKGWEGYDLSSRNSTVIDLTASNYDLSSRAALLDAWARSLGEAPTAQPVELSTHEHDPARARARALADQWAKENA